MVQTRRFYLRAGRSKSVNVRRLVVQKWTRNLLPFGGLEMPPAAHVDFHAHSRRIAIMSGEEERHKKAMLLFEYTEGKQHLALLKKDARDMAEKFENLAALIRKDAARIDNPEGEVPSYKEVFELARRIHDAEYKVAELRSTAVNAGVVIEDSR